MGGFLDGAVPKEQHLESALVQYSEAASKVITGHEQGKVPRRAPQSDRLGVQRSRLAGLCNHCQV